MAVIWHLKNGSWASEYLDPEEAVGFRLQEACLQRVDPSDGLLVVLPPPLTHPSRYVLVGPLEGIRINGYPFWGIRVLRDGDEIGLCGLPPLFFSDQKFVRVVQVLPEVVSAICPVCGDPVTAPAVCCPGCGLWHHENEARPCWSSGGTCSTYGCGQPTRTEGERIWTPLDLAMGEGYGISVAAEATELVR